MINYTYFVEPNTSLFKFELRLYMRAIQRDGLASIKIIYRYRLSREECARLRENVPYAKVHRYNPKHLYPKLNGYGDNGERSLKV